MAASFTSAVATSTTASSFSMISLGLLMALLVMVFFVLIRVIVMMGMTLSLLVVGVLVFLMSVLVRVVVGMLVLMLVVSLLSFGLGRLGMLQSLSFFVLLLLGGKLLVCNSLVNLRIQQSILDEGSEILEDYALVVFVGASSQMSEQVSEIINWSVVLERLDAMLGMGNHVVKRVHQTRQGSTLGICGFDKAVPMNTGVEAVETAIKLARRKLAASSGVRK